jgi:hypothetical protein
LTSACEAAEAQQAQAAAAQMAEPLLPVFAASLMLLLLSHAVLPQTTFEEDVMILALQYD